MVNASFPITKGLTVVLARNGEDIYGLFTIAFTVPKLKYSNMQHLYEHGDEFMSGTFGFDHDARSSMWVIAGWTRREPTHLP